MNIMQSLTTQLCLAAVLTLSACAGMGSDIKSPMKDLKSSHAAAMSAATMGEFKTHAQAFGSAAQAAAAANYSGTPAEQALYKQGTAGLMAGMPALNAAIAADDLAGAKKIIDQLAGTRSKYHPTLKK